MTATALIIVDIIVLVGAGVLTYLLTHGKKDNKHQH